MIDETEFGTTIVGLLARDGVVLGSDRRASAGGTVRSKHADKVFPVDDRAALAFTGSVAGAQALAANLESEVRLYELRRGGGMSVAALATLAGNVMREDPVPVQHLLGGVDDAGSHLYGFDAGGAAIEQRYAADGSGGPIAYGVLEDGYDAGIDEGGPSLADARSLAARAVAAANERDLASGDGLCLATLTGDGIEVEVYDDPAAAAS